MAFYEIPGQARNDGGQAPTRRPHPVGFFYLPVSRISPST